MSVKMPYTVQGKQYIDGDSRERQKDALGFLKDWVVALLTVETAILTLASGAVAGMKDLPTLPILETVVVSFIALSFVISIYNGMFLLNQLPAAAQRVPDNDEAKSADIYAIGVRQDSDRIVDLTNRFRGWFIVGIALLAVFIVLRTLTAWIVPVYDGVLPIKTIEEQVNRIEEQLKVQQAEISSLDKKVTHLAEAQKVVLDEIANLNSKVNNLDTRATNLEHAVPPPKPKKRPKKRSKR